MLWGAPSARLSAPSPLWSIALSHPVGPSNLTAGRTDVFNEQLLYSLTAAFNKMKNRKIITLKLALRLRL